MKINELKLNTNVIITRNLIQEDTDKFGIFFDYDRICEYYFVYSMRLAQGERELAKMLGLNYFNMTDRSAKEHVLLNVLKIDKSFFVKYGKFSMDKECIEKAYKYYNGVNSDCVQAVWLKKYLELNEVRTLASSLKSYRALPLSKAEDVDGHRMVVAHPTWNILNTSRLSATNPGIQTVGRTIGDIITAPKGWNLVRGDSGQIEPRIMWSYFMPDKVMQKLITYYDDAYFAYFDYVTMKDDELKLLYEDFDLHFKPKEKSGEFLEKRQQMKRISLAAGYGSSLPTDAGFDPILAKLYTEKIVNHPLRKKWEEDVKERVASGQSTFYGAFGTPVTPGETERYNVGDSGWTSHLLRCGINNPVQTTASELMMFAVKQAHELLAMRPKSKIAYYKHDEGCFYVADEDMDIKEQLASCQSYEVAGWIPIHSELEEGRKAGDKSVICLL